MTQDRPPRRRGKVHDAPEYSEVEQRALSLAAELRARVQRERATVANLRAYLTRRGPSE